MLKYPQNLLYYLNFKCNGNEMFEKYMWCDWIRNEEIRIRVVDLSVRAERCTLWWFGYVKQMNDGRIAKKYESGVERKLGRGRPYSMDG